jgi:hypothetical protein
MTKTLSLIGIGLVLGLLLLFLFWRAQEETRRWLQPAPTGFAGAYRGFGVAGTCPVNREDSVFIYCDTSRNGGSRRG